jgi:hypothetical protein
MHHSSERDSLEHANAGVEDLRLVLPIEPNKDPLTIMLNHDTDGATWRGRPPYKAPEDGFYRSNHFSLLGCHADLGQHG